ncbi:hypothetical protein I3842_10G048400 [Carya illinoinensis]|uniref:Lipoxygenase domain-containing protein n=1 Tax=Carya illinoinensis TaxID=32201 RepID=A0A922J2G3_CARIL|nr:hypothetical protein I3842_10G048400 [Carya illinoinensis]
MLQIPSSWEALFSSSTEIDPRTMKPKTIQTAGGKTSTYRVDLTVESDFGVPGAITVCNKYQKVFFLESIAIEGVVHEFVCNSWVQAEKLYLPWETPTELKELRDEELRELKGDGKGLKIPFDRAYDYDATLGGEKNPHPRRCRTERPPTESRLINAYQSIYVSRDEALEKGKIDALNLGKLKGILWNIIPSLTVAKSDVFKDFPPKSKLYPSIYGEQESGLGEEYIEGNLNGMSVQQAMEENKLFILDYHDMYLPFLNQINSLEDRKAYATLTIFFLTPMGTLKPIAIELSLPAVDPNSSPNQVLTPPIDPTTYCLWQLGKAHVCSNDSGVHQLVHHWLRTHACMEPLIIAAHQQLSVMHPIYKLLDPHIRYTLKINEMACDTPINAKGIIETNFTAGKYCRQISCYAYGNWWRFDQENLPADLIRRGVAVLDQTQAHGLRLLIEDYPYATDGLLIWFAIEDLVQTYVDLELQPWYNESINVGHADLRHASWWPKLSTPAQHAALNFGQYPYGGFIPTRVPLMRQLIPKENGPENKIFINDPKGYFLSSLPSWSQNTKYMAVIDIISSHSPDEEYIGAKKDLSTWSGDTEIIEAFYIFSMEIRRIEKEIEKKKSDINLRNRFGAGISPYELLMPSSGPRVTCRGVPNCITV